MKLRWTIMGFGSLMAIATAGAMLFFPPRLPLAQAQVNLAMERPFLLDLLDDLDLTDDQLSELRQLRQSTQTQWDAIVTDSQRDSFRTTLQQGGTLMEAIAAMNLDDDQRSQLRTVALSSLQSAREILTPEQQAQIRTLLESRTQQNP